jgi:hypothetical protein
MSRSVPARTAISIKLGFQLSCPSLLPFALDG